MEKINVGFCYNRIDEFPRELGAPEDINVEWTDDQDILTIHNGLLEAGYKVLDIGNPINLLKEELRNQVDVVFSIAEMIGFRYRESIAPLICEIFEIPYTFSSPDSLVIALDKHLSNLIVKNIGVNVPEWFLVKNEKEVDDLSINDYPYIVKPVAEGSSMGIYVNSITRSAFQTRDRVLYILENYKQPAMVQRYIKGREITVGVIECNDSILPLKPLELLYDVDTSTKINDPKIKNSSSVIQPLTFLTNPELEKNIRDLALEIFKAFDCKGTARVDFRVVDDDVYFIEINPLTDYTPRKDFCKSAFAYGFTYASLLRTIIDNALKNLEGKSKNGSISGKNYELLEKSSRKKYSY